MLQGRKCLITGVAGFLGSHLAERLLREGATVAGIDNFITGKKENLKHLYGEGFRFFYHDVTKPVGFSEEFDFIFHFASPASPVHYEWYPLETALVNSVGTQHLLELALRGNTRVVLASTSEVYGDPAVHPQTEDYNGNVNMIGPRACYDESKRFAETLAHIYHQEFGLDVTILRIFNTYGPRMRRDDGRVISNFVTQALRDAPLTIYGDGNQTRSLCYVDDLIDGVIRASLVEAPEVVLNLGNPEELRIIELADMVKELTGSQSEKVFMPAKKDEPMQRRPDITRAKNLLGWTPSVSLREGLRRTVEWFRKNGA